MMTLTQEHLREILNYDSETGVFTWRVRRGNKMPAGSVAGYIANHGRRMICVDYRQFEASWLAFLYMTGQLPPFEMDHENCIPDDDRWSNLRAATSTQNKANTRVRKNKRTSSFKGVSFHKHSNKYRAHITINGRHISLGYFDDPATAHAAYVEAAKKHFGEFARAK